MIPPPDQRPAGGTTSPLRRQAAQGFNNVFVSLEWLAGGLITALAALVTLIVVCVVGALSLIGVGIPLIPSVLRMVRSVADRERQRLNRWGDQMVPPYDGPVPSHPVVALRQALDGASTRRDLAWLVCHSTLGLTVGLLGVLLPVIAIRDTLFPLWWTFLPEGMAGGSIGVPVNNWNSALSVSLMGLGWTALLFGLGTSLAWIQSWPGRSLLNPSCPHELSERVAGLITTRAAILRAHTAELRRIERSLHDGAQSRLVGVSILVGTALRALDNDPERARTHLEQAQSAAEVALTELRATARGILPPTLQQHGLAGTLATIVAECAVPCSLDTEGLVPCASSVEATAYFITAELLANVTRHSHAHRASVRVTTEGGLVFIEVWDDGRGGADPERGTGLTGIGQRTAAHNGNLSVRSPRGGPTTIRVELPCGS